MTYFLMFSHGLPLYRSQGATHDVASIKVVDRAHFEDGYMSKRAELNHPVQESPFNHDAIYIEGSDIYGIKVDRAHCMMMLT